MTPPATPGPAIDPLPPAPPLRPAISHAEGPGGGRAALLLLAIMFSALVAAVLTFLLPDSNYIRYQQARDSNMFHVAWIYERINFDPAPIDVAVVGASHLEAGVSPTALAQNLSARAGRTITATNLSLIRPGRDYTYLTVQNLLEKHPETRIVVLAADGDSMFSHPMFKAVADARDVFGAPLLVNIKYLENALYLPYRNMDYAAQSLWPGPFGVRGAFDRSRYLGTDLDRTFGYRLPDGAAVNGDKRAASAMLRKESQDVIAADTTGGMRYLRYLPADEAQPGERFYIRKIAALCRRHGTKILFVALPIYGGYHNPIDQAFYDQFGPTVHVAGLDDRAELFWNGGHLNRQGAVLATRQVADALAPMLPNARPKTRP